MVIYLSVSGGPARENVAQPKRTLSVQVEHQKASCLPELPKKTRVTSQSLIAMDKNHLLIVMKIISGSNNVCPESDHIYGGWIRASSCLSSLNRLVAEEAAGGLWNLYVGEEIIVFRLNLGYTIQRKFVGK
ncbi:unnamed protein product [Thlaspi arvense]|uniref:Uncharacterized protein n=1 Tax=Thlaspi arvense TaxID=13288 RepID=A0AAU9RN70_THLAR|nr:unnamed protein product [Thlaspi arvense]